MYEIVSASDSLHHQLNLYALAASADLEEASFRHSTSEGGAMLRKRSLSTPIFIILAMLVSLTWAPGMWAVKYKTLYSFKGGKDGIEPSGNLVFDANGNLYGTTLQGGGTSACNGYEFKGCGIVFQLLHKPNGSWKENVLYSFQNGSSGGVGLNGSLVLDSQGNLYGTAFYDGPDFQGTVFQLSPGSGGWTESTIYQFCSVDRCTDGASPGAGVIFDHASNVLGTTTAGGVNGLGVIFELAPGSGNWTESVLYSFDDGSGGWLPWQLTQDANGNLYGTTAWGGDYNWPCTPGDGCGVIFELSPVSRGWNYSVLRRLNGSRDGATPTSGVIRDKDDNVYGTTTGNGAFGCGTVFELSPKKDGGWAYKVLYNLRDGVSAGSLALDSGGNIYGALTTETLGTCQAKNEGEIFKLSPAAPGRWKYRTIYQLAQPSSGLIFGKNGSLYGVAAGGYGLVFELTP
jgi:uncharacterized repeat protein (TIGR03803 family)